MSILTMSARVITAALIALTIGVVSAAPAVAGTYLMRNCNVPGQPSAPLGPWQAAPSAGTAVTDTCMSGGAVGISSLGMARFERSGINLVRPTEGPHSRIRFAAVRLWLVTRLEGSGGPLDVQMYHAMGPFGRGWTVCRSRDFRDPAGGYLRPTLGPRGNDRGSARIDLQQPA